MKLNMTDIWNLNRISKQVKRSFFLVLVLLFWHSASAQLDRYPANVTPFVNEPASVYISDYVEVGSERFIGNILFNDFNEASWTFKLKMTIQSSDVQLTTKSTFIPSAPITVLPGELYKFSGSDWTEYFNFANLDIRGDVSGVMSSGRLPEGQYSFCLQVLDYATGDPLSEEICASIYIKLLDPPLVVSPLCNTIINPVTQTTFPITWQLYNTRTPRGSIPEFQLTIWEMLDPTANPLSAVANGQALQVYQSEIVTNTTLSYGPSEPLLDLGKTYIYRIQAVDENGRSYFKNNGYSEFCYFHYGYPVGGKIRPLFPDYDAGFRRGMTQRVRWSRPSNWVPNYAIDYELIVKEIGENEDPESAIIANPVWKRSTKTGILIGIEQSSLLDKLDIEQKYAWQVKAFANDVEVAKSDVSTFFGPSLVEAFYAGNYKVLVDFISNKDLNDLSGGGRVQLSDSDDDWYEVEFERLKVEERSGLYYLKSGNIITEIPQRSYPLAARFEDNGPGEFLYDEFKLDKDGMQIKGYFKWDVPFAVEEGNLTYVKSQKKWLSFNGFRVFGNVDFEDLSYDLFDPSNFTLKLSKSSKVFINQDKFDFSINGTLIAPEMIKSISGGASTWAFTDAEQLSIINTATTQPILAFENAGIEIHPQVGIIDLSDNESPGKKSADAYWKGIYLVESKVKFNNNFDKDDQLAVDSPFDRTMTHNQSSTSESWIDVQGLEFNASIDFSGSEAYFNTFPAEYTNLTLDIHNNHVQDNSMLEGSIIVPIVDQSIPFDFEVQVYDKGFRPGTISNLTGTDFTHNPEGGDLKLNVSILKSEIVDKESIRMTLDLEWPSLDISFKSVPNFMVWGNYSIGFFTPEGIVALAEQIQTKFKDFPVTIDALSAGRNKEQYGIAISGKVVMGEDVSGDEGAPAFNLYSLVKNSSLDESYEPAKVQGAVDLGSAQSGLAQIEEELASLEQDLNSQLEEEEAALESVTSDALTAAASSIGGQQYEAEELINETDEDQPKIDYANVKEEVIFYLKTLQDALPFIAKTDADYNEKYAKIQAIIDGIEKIEDEVEELQIIIDKLKGFGDEFAAEQLASLADPVLKQVDSVTLAINNRIINTASSLTDEVENLVETAVGTVVDNAANQVIASLSDKAPNIAAIVGEIAVTTKRAVVNEVMSSVTNSVNENVVFPVTGFISTSISERAHRLVDNTAKSVAMGALSGDLDPKEIMNEVLDGFKDEFKNLGEEVASKVDADKMLETIKSLGQDAIGNIDPKRISARIAQGAKEAITSAVADAAAQKFEEFANNALGDEIGVEVPVDFAAAGLKALAKGNPKELLFDPIPIKVRSNVLEINGLIHFMKDHPIYGDGFAGDVEAFIKKPNQFTITLAYINGRKDGLSYWMAEVGGAATATEPSNESEPTTDMSNVGKAGMDDNNAPPPDGLKLGPLEIMALRGRIYHHMSAEGFGELTPDANVNYGAFLHLIMFGPKKGTKMRLEVDAAMSTFATGDYTWDFDGNAQFISTNPQVNAIDDKAVIKATLTLSYNSAERHFFGYAAAEVNKTGTLCASGSLLVDTRPGAWRVAVGSKEEKIRFIIACAGFGPTGWLDINQNTAFLGLGLEFIFYTSIDLNVGIAKVGLVFDAGAAIGIQALIQHSPDFMIMEAGVWLELWAKIYLSYKTALKSGSVTLADIYIAADAIMRFNPQPTVLYGKVEGRIKILFLNFGFNKNFEMNM